MRFFGSSAVLFSKYVSVTVNEVYDAHKIRLVKDILMRIEAGSDINIKDRKFVPVLESISAYQQASLDCYGNEELFDLCDCDKPVDPYESYFTALSCQKVKEAYCRVSNECRKINVKTKC